MGEIKMKKSQKEINEPKIMSCIYSGLKNCLKQSPDIKIDQSICTNCLLGRIEKHLFSIVKKMYNEK